ncbi:hypothetical protein [Natronomonas salsuginis]|jgi:hypothetical protein|uniref:DUF8151 domain-containing protein n=1 Tax=Natronomonas salsuginis TaxID=2217661 RepID=A0A4U5JBN0_9EURY|nr:hypothetical protein [Natronomonas salsuginis]TKR25616.1 hypothetical protein DM868_09365 [Natronomonas salsuginis]
MKELLAPIVELLVYAVIAAGFTVAGVLAELTSAEYLAAGNLHFAVWLSVMGAVALYAGIVALGLDEVLPRLRDTVDES